MMNRNVLDAISQRYLQGERPSVIAATLGISVNTVKSHLRRHPIDPSLVYCQNCGAASLGGITDTGAVGARCNALSHRAEKQANEGKLRG